MITERTLRNWRLEALESNKAMNEIRTNQVKEDLNCPTLLISTMAERILRLTMELMDIRLMERLRGKK